MSDPRPAAGGTSTALSVLMILVGVVLLLPGLCAGFFAVAFISEQGFNDSSLVGLWLVCFLIAAGGIAMIWHAVRRLRA